MQRLARWGSLMMADATPQTDVHGIQVDKNKSALDKNSSCHSETNRVFPFYEFEMRAGAGQAARVFVFSACGTAFLFRKPLIRNAFLDTENCLVVDKAVHPVKWGGSQTQQKLLPLVRLSSLPLATHAATHLFGAPSSPTGHQQVFQRPISRAHVRRR